MLLIEEKQVRDILTPEKCIAAMRQALADLESRGETNGRLDVVSGAKADYRPEVSPSPDPQLYGYAPGSATAAPTLSDGATPTPVPAS